MFTKKEKGASKVKEKRISKVKEKINDGLDDFSSFGIKPISDKDVEEEFKSMMQENGLNFDSDDGVDDEDLASTLRELGIKPTDLKNAGSMNEVDLMDSGDECHVQVSEGDLKDPHLLNELREIGWTGDQCETIQIEEIQQQIEIEKKKAIALKRSGNIPDALVVMRRIKELEIVFSTATEKSTQNSVSHSTNSNLEIVTIQKKDYSHVPIQQHETPKELDAFSTKPPNDSDQRSHIQEAQSGEEDCDAIEVTESDMNDPLLNAELEKMNLGHHQETMNQDDSVAALKKNNPYSVPDGYDSGADMEDEFEQDVYEENVYEENVSKDQDDAIKATTGTSMSSTTTVVKEVDVSAEVKLLKALAVQYNKSGNRKEAIETLKKAKELEERLVSSNDDLKGNDDIADHKVCVADTKYDQDLGNQQNKFRELEGLLVQFGNETRKKAKEVLSKDKKKGSDLIEKSKYYRSELDKLREKRQNVNQMAPDFYIARKEELIEMMNENIPDNQLVLRITSVLDCRVVAGKDCFIKFDLGFGSNTGNTPSVRCSNDGTCSFSFEHLVPLKRSRGTEMSFQLRKMSFEVRRTGGFLRSEQFIGKAIFELKYLLSKSTVDTTLPLLDSNRRPVGGTLKFQLLMRTPIKEKEFRSIEVQELIIGEYPLPQILNVNKTNKKMETNESEKNSSRLSQEVNGNQVNKNDVKVNRASKTSLEWDKETELQDPLNINLVDSYDVMGYEISKLEEDLSRYQNMQLTEEQSHQIESMEFNLNSLQLKKQCLEIEMQSGKLTLDVYLARLHSRLKKDRYLEEHLKVLGRKQDALRVLGRVEIMQKEIEGADAT